MSLLVCKNVSKSFGKKEGKFFVCKNISISFPSAGFYAIKGKSGSGKSTFLNLLSRLAKPSSGKIYYKKKNLWKMNEKEISSFHSSETGIIFQHHNLIEETTALENVMMPLLIEGMDKKKARRKAYGKFAEFKMESLAEKQIENLSGGERQRVAILRCLVRDPSVLFADEPTGALDEASSNYVMSLLLKISSSKLVIMVSHNEELIETYCPNILRYENGNLHVEKIGSASNKPYSPFQNKQTGKGWTYIFTRRNLKRNVALNSVSFLATFIGFSCLLLCLGFYQGSGSIKSNEATRRLDYQLASISKKSYTDIENSPLQLVKSVRPSFEEINPLLKGIPSSIVLNDYSFFFASYRSFFIDESSFEACDFIPFYDLSKAPYLIQGRLPNSGEEDAILVNEEFITNYGIDCLGKQMNFLQSYNFAYHGKTISGEISFSFKIVGVVSEFSFLNSAKVYYSYKEVDRKLSSIYFDAASSKKSLASLVKEADGESEFSNYSYFIFVENKSDVELLLKEKSKLESESSSLEIDSSAYSSLSAFSTLMDAFSYSLISFVGMALFGVVLIIAMTSYSNFVKRKKENAILMTLGAGRKQLESIFYHEAILLSVFSSLLTIVLLPYFQEWMNQIINQKFHISSLIQVPLNRWLNLPYFLPFSLLSLSAFLSLLSSLLPLHVLGRFQVAEVLKEE